MRTPCCEKVKVNVFQNDIKRVPTVERSDSGSSPKLNDLETSLETLTKENQLLKKRYEQLVNKEKQARDEIRELKAQLLRKYGQRSHPSKLPFKKP